jgi:hypothetical protein
MYRLGLDHRGGKINPLTVNDDEVCLPEQDMVSHVIGMGMGCLNFSLEILSRDLMRGTKTRCTHSALPIYFWIL